MQELSHHQKSNLVRKPAKSHVPGTSANKELFMHSACACSSHFNKKAPEKMRCSIMHD